MTRIRPYAKAVVGTAVAFLGSLGAAMADHHGVTGEEWVAIATTTVVAAGAIFGVTNTPA